EDLEEIFEKILRLVQVAAQIRAGDLVDDALGAVGEAVEAILEVTHGHVPGAAPDAHPLGLLEPLADPLGREAARLDLARSEALVAARLALAELRVLPGDALS